MLTRRNQNMFKKLVSVALFAAITTAAMAKDVKLILPNPAGSSSDIVARAVADEFARQNPGDNLVLDYAPGGEHLVAVNKFKTQSDLTVILGTTTMHVFNHVTKPDLPYKDSEFSHATWIGWSPHIWYTSANSKYKTISDFNDALNRGEKINAGVDALSTQANAMSVQRFHKSGDKVTMVKYKGSPQTLAAVMGGEVDVGNSSISTAIIEAAKAGKIVILSTTHSSPVKIDGLPEIPVGAKTLGVQQFNGGFLISIGSQYADSAEGKAMKAKLINVVKSDSVKETLAKIRIQVEPMTSEATTKMLNEYRETVSVLVK